MEAPPPYTNKDFVNSCYYSSEDHPFFMELVMKRLGPCDFDEHGAFRNDGMLLEQRTESIMVYPKMAPEDLRRIMHMRIASGFDVPYDSIGHPFHGECVRDGTPGPAGGVDVGQRLWKEILILEVDWMKEEDWMEEHKRLARAQRRVKIEAVKAALWKVAMAFRRRR